MTEKQYKFAWEIANSLGLMLPNDWSNKAFSSFIDAKLPSYRIWQQEEMKKQQLRVQVCEQEYYANYELAHLQDMLEAKARYEQGLEILN